MTDHDLEQIRAVVQDALAPLRADIAVLQADVAALKTRIVTAGEMEAVHHDLNRMVLEVARLGARIGPAR